MCSHWHSSLGSPLKNGDRSVVLLKADRPAAGEVLEVALVALDGLVLGRGFL